MYQVISNDEVKGRFFYFFDAWLCAVVEHPNYTCIRGPDGVWFHPRFN